METDVRLYLGNHMLMAAKSSVTSCTQLSVYLVHLYNVIQQSWNKSDLHGTIVLLEIKQSQDFQPGGRCSCPGVVELFCTIPYMCTSKLISQCLYMQSTTSVELL